MAARSLPLNDDDMESFMETLEEIVEIVPFKDINMNDEFTFFESSKTTTTIPTSLLSSRLHNDYAAPIEHSFASCKPALPNREKDCLDRFKDMSRGMYDKIFRRFEEDEDILEIPFDEHREANIAFNIASKASIETSAQVTEMREQGTSTPCSRE